MQQPTEIPTRRGSKVAPFVLCLPLTLLSYAITYFALATAPALFDSFVNRQVHYEGVSLIYTSIVENLTYTPVDWVVSDDETNQVLDWLEIEQQPGLKATVLQLQADGLLDRLLVNVSETDHATFGPLLERIDSALPQRAGTKQASADFQIPLGPFDWFFGDAQERQAATDLLLNGGYFRAFYRYAVIALFVATLFVMTSMLGYVRRRWSLQVIRANYWLLNVAGLFYFVVTWKIGAYLESVEHFGEAQTAVSQFYWWYDLAWPVALIVAFGAILHVYSYRADIIHLYTEHFEEEAVGDRIFEDARTGGRDPQYRRSWLASAFTHVFFLIILPWLLTFYGCVEDYRVPKGSGNPVVAMVRVVQKQKVEKKTYILNPHSAISFKVPTLDEDSDIEEQIKEMIEHPYEASNAMAGKMGAGGGTTGGWPDGMENAEVRFIRLSYGGPEWDDGMGVNDGRADMNFLDEFHRQTGFKIRSYSESHPIHYLAKYRPGYAPPFVYMTGNGGISISGRDIRIMRDYLEGGGMLFADCGYPSFHNSFVGLMQRVFPSKRMRVIADDDPLFQMPYRFSNGPPPLWHHGGNRCLGIKHKGRWCVFYHPGDINDAWKTGHSGIGPTAARGAYQVGINVIYYSFTNYLALTRKFRK